MQDREDVEAVFASRLRETRDRAGLSQARLAALLSEQFGIDLDPTAITRIERGQRGIGLAEAHAMASALEVTLESLCRPDPLPASEQLERRLREANTALRDHRVALAAAVHEVQALEKAIAGLEIQLAAAREAEGRAARDRAAAAQDEALVRLQAYEDVREVGKIFAAGRSVVLDVSGAREYIARRAIGFAAGLAYGLRGSMTRAGADNKVFRLDPAPPAEPAPASAPPLAAHGDTGGS